MRHFRLGPATITHAGIITELTVKLNGTPEAISTAVCSFPTVEAALNTVVTTI